MAYREKSNTQLIEQYADMVYRICVSHLAGLSKDLADDAFQNVFLKAITAAPPFKSDEHEKAWLIRCAINECYNLFRDQKKRRQCPLEVVQNEPADSVLYGEDTQVYKQVLALPEKYRIPLLLYYVEGYETCEIARILRITQAGVWQRLRRAREKLKAVLGGIDDEWV